MLSKKQNRIPAVIWWATVGILGIIVLYPLVVLILNSFKTADGYGLDNYIMLMQDASIGTSVLNTVKVVVPSTILSTLIGVILAWVVVRTNVPGKKVWEHLLAIPYFIPPFIGAIAWTFLLGPIGHVNQLLAHIMGTARGPINVYSIGGMVFVLTIYRYAVSYMIVLPAMKKVSASIEEAARMSGASVLRTLKDVTLPILTPSILGAMLLTFMFILSDFGVSAVLGIPNQIRLMTTQIYFMISKADGSSMQMASAYSILLSLCGLLGLALYNRILKKNKYVSVTGKSNPAEPTKLGFSKWFVFAGLLVFFLMSSVAPIAATLLTSCTKTVGLGVSMDNLSLQNFAVLAQVQNVGRAVKNSLFLSFVSAIAICVITFIIGYISVRRNIRGIKGISLMQTLVTLPYALPGTIIAFAMILAFSQPIPGTNIKIYNTIWIMLIAYIARYLNLGFNNITGAISQIDMSLEEASRMSGVGFMGTMMKIVFPLLKKSLVTSIFLVVAPTISEITLSSLLWSVNNETIGTIIYAAQEEGRVLRVAAMAILLMIFSILLNAWIQRLGTDDKKKASVDAELLVNVATSKAKSAGGMKITKEALQAQCKNIIGMEDEDIEAWQY